MTTYTLADAMLYALVLLAVAVVAGLAWKYRAWLMDHSEVPAFVVVFLLGAVGWALFGRPMPKRQEDPEPGKLDEATRKAVRDNIVKRQEATKVAEVEVAPVEGQTADEMSERLQDLARRGRS